MIGWWLIDDWLRDWLMIDMWWLMSEIWGLIDWWVMNDEWWVMIWWLTSENDEIKERNNQREEKTASLKLKMKMRMRLRIDWWRSTREKKREEKRLRISMIFEIEIWGEKRRDWWLRLRWFFFEIWEKRLMIARIFFDDFFEDMRLEDDQTRKWWLRSENDEIALWMMILRERRREERKEKRKKTEEKEEIGGWPPYHLSPRFFQNGRVLVAPRRHVFGRFIRESMESWIFAREWVTDSVPRSRPHVGASEDDSIRAGLLMFAQRVHLIFAPMLGLTMVGEAVVEDERWCWPWRKTSSGSFVLMSFIWTWTRRLTMIGWAVATVGLNCVWDLDLTCFAILQLAPVLSLWHVRERMQLMNLRCRAVFWQPKAPTFVADVRQ